jgi:hypothetical protein
VEGLDRPDWQNWPQRACVGAPRGDALVEIVVTAVVKR